MPSLPPCSLGIPMQIRQISSQGNARSTDNTDMQQGKRDALERRAENKAPRQTPPLHRPGWHRRLARQPLLQMRTQSLRNQVFLDAAAAAFNKCHRQLLRKKQSEVRPAM